MSQQLMHHCRLILTFLMTVFMTLGIHAQSQPALQRKAWTQSEIHGSPETPPPYSSQAVFEKLDFKHALEMIHVGERLLVVERGGKIWSFSDQQGTDQTTLLIDLKKLHPKLSYAYGLAFHPDWEKTHEVFITYTIGHGLEDGTHLSRFRLKEGRQLQLDPSSEKILLTWKSGGHNGAHLRFGPDGMLYISTGDAAIPSPPDIYLTGQDNSDLLSSILRIDIDHKSAATAYSIPKDNPYVGIANVRPEVWAFGFRNPWKINFDPKGKLWVGDVGWELWEMIHLVGKGHNAGWSAMEASQPIKPESANPISPISAPVMAHPHSEAASITGGFIYRGSRLPELRGAYIYGDYETGKIWALWHDGTRITKHQEIADTPHRIASFGEAQDGSLYYIDYASPTGIYQLIPNPKAKQKSTFPRKLSQTGLFTDTQKQIPADGVYQYQIIEPLWQDGAIAKRFIALPDKSKIQTHIEYHKDHTIRRSKLTWPTGTVLAKTISTEHPTQHKIETQILHYDGESWHPYSYRWNPSGDDAQLVEAAGTTVTVPKEGWQGGSSYRIHSRSQCNRCHNSWNQFVLGFQPWQLKYLPQSQNPPIQESAIALGLLDRAFFQRNTRGLLFPTHGRGSIESRARSWLHTNCSTCHRRHGGGSAPLEVNFELPLSATSMLFEKPTRGDFGLDQASIIVPGHPERSTLLYRISALGSAHMPLIGAQEIDQNAVTLLRQWISELPHTKPSPHPALKPGLSSTSAAMKLIATLDQLKPKQHEAIIAEALASPNANISALFLPFLPAEKRPQTLAATIDSHQLLKIKGDPKNGSRILSPTGKWAACFACHSVDGKGGNLGPDLSKIGSQMNKAQILQSIIFPSQAIRPEYQLWTVKSKNGKTTTGFITQQTPTTLTLRLTGGSTDQLNKKDILEQHPSPTSLMPEGLLQTLTEQEAADVLAWLNSLK
ncbi:MAG: PQQ-dependent sugar dehydrogenase [Verrucomicrobiales bacterium]|nr:PQQ-dependent sugar dehydrogenase [Verrucomicrobiales bacterium]